MESGWLLNRKTILGQYNVWMPLLNKTQYPKKAAFVAKFVTRPRQVGRPTGWLSSMVDTSSAPFHNQLGLGQRALGASWARNLHVAVHRKMEGHTCITLKSDNAWGFSQGGTTCTTVFWFFFGNFVLFEHFV